MLEMIGLTAVVTEMVVINQLVGSQEPVCLTKKARKNCQFPDNSIIYKGKTEAASNTGPSTHTRFMAGPSSVMVSIVHPAQPPTAQAIYSSMDIWQGRLYSCAR